MITIKPNDIKSETNKISLKNNSSIVLGKIGDIEYEPYETTGLSDKEYSCLKY